VEDLNQTQFEDAMNVLMTRHSALRTIILPSGKQQIEPIEHFRPFQLLVHDNDVKGDASVLFSGTMSGSCVNRKSIDKVLGYPHPAKEDLYVFATHDGSDTKLVGTYYNTWDISAATLTSDHYRIAKGLIDLESAGAVIAAFESASREGEGQRHTIANVSRVLWRQVDEVRQELLAHFGYSMPLWKVEALRFGDSRMRLFFLFDLLVADARALTVLTEELWHLYQGGTVAELPNSTLSMPLYVHLNSQRRADPDQKGREEAFWAKLCDQEPGEGGLHQHPQLPLAPDQENGHISRISSSMSAEKWQRLCTACRAEGISQSSLLFAIYTAVLGTWCVPTVRSQCEHTHSHTRLHVHARAHTQTHICTNAYAYTRTHTHPYMHIHRSSSKQFTMNVALFSRDVGLHTDAQRLVGNLSSTALVPVDLSVKAAPTLRDLAKQLQDAMLNVMEHSICTSGTDAMARLNRRDGTIGRAVAPFVFASVLQEGEGINRAANPFTWYGKTPKHSALTTPQVWLDVQVFTDVDGSLYFNWDAHVERFADGLVNTMFQAFCNLLENLADEAGCQQALSARPVLPPSSDQMVNRLNNAALKPGLNPQLMHQAILQQAQQTPHATAIFDAATGQAYTFEEVVKLARSFATAIVTAEEADYSGGDGLKRKLPGHPVAVYMKKGWQQVLRDRV